MAEGGALARRFPPDIGPFAALSEMSPQGFAALAALMSPSDYAVLFTPDPVTAPAEFKILLAKTGEQMVGMPAEASISSNDIVTLDAGDVPEMMALTKLTNPGPFAARTHQLGTFLGVKVGGRLVAMAGERMKPADYTEITPSACIRIIAVAVTRRCCLEPSRARLQRVGRSRSCTSFPTTTVPSRYTGGRAWKSGDACM